MVDFGDKISVNFLKEQSAEICHRKLHHILHRKKNCHLELTPEHPRLKNFFFEFFIFSQKFEGFS